MTLLGRATSYLFTAVLAQQGRAVTYRRGASSAAVTAAVGKTAFLVADNSGSVTRTESRDYLIGAADLKFGDVPVVPQLHDTIEETVGGQALTFEVFAPPGADCASTADADKTFWRIHTKKIATA